MKITLLKILVLILFILNSSFLFSQEKKRDTLKTEVVDVVKPFTPKVKESFKIKEIPSIDLKSINQKKKINYSFFSVPVASTFIPNKGTPKFIQKIAREIFYKNYISLGYGIYTTPLVDMYLQTSTNNDNEIGGFFNYISSDGGINNAVLNTKYVNSDVLLFYKELYQDYSWKINGKYERKDRNWYGLPTQINFNQNIVNSINAKQYYNTIKLIGDVDFKEAYLHGGSINFTHFSDGFSSKENRIQFSSDFEYPFLAEIINTKVSIDYLNTHFKKDYNGLNFLKTTFFNVGIQPSIKILKNNLRVDLGAKLYYATADNNQDNKFLIYPNIIVSYGINNNSLIAFAGLVGDVQLNSYQKFVNKNNFVSPTLILKRTENTYQAYLGTKGILNKLIHFNAKISYGKYKNMPLFKLNASKTDGTIAVVSGYEAGNSFQVVYDDVNKLQVFSEFDVNYSKLLNFGGSITFNNYSLTKEMEAWNLPQVRASFFGKYSFNKWYAKTEIYFVGLRKDEFNHQITTSTIITPQLIKNKSFTDINFNGGYHFSNRFDAFAKFNNVLNNHYQSFSNYQVQGFQVLVGITYKFDI